MVEPAERMRDAGGKRFGRTVADMGESAIIETMFIAVNPFNGSVRER
jgi:hypothetical protein